MTGDIIATVTTPAGTVEIRRLEIVGTKPGLLRLRLDADMPHALAMRIAELVAEQKPNEPPA